MSDVKPRLGVSACLLGQPVRYDGGHKWHRQVCEFLPHYFELVPVCPERDCGLGVPREPMHLVGDPASPRLVSNRTARDLTAQMQGWCERRARELGDLKLVGFVGKVRSPSCGLHVPLSGAAGGGPRYVEGLWMRCLRRLYPSWLLVEESALVGEHACLNLIAALVGGGRR